MKYIIHCNKSASYTAPLQVHYQAMIIQLPSFNSPPSWRVNTSLNKSELSTGRSLTCCQPCMDWGGLPFGPIMHQAISGSGCFLHLLFNWQWQIHTQGRPSQRQWRWSGGRSSGWTMRGRMQEGRVAGGEQQYEKLEELQLWQVYSQYSTSFTGFITKT